MAQIDMSKRLGFTGITLKKVIFPDTKGKLEKFIDKIFIPDNIVALAAPTWIHFSFWEKHISTIEFTQYGEKVRRDPMMASMFLCKGVWIFEPSGSKVISKYVPCNMSVKDQITYLGMDERG